MPNVSVVIPTLNEEESIKNCLTTIFGVFATRKIDGEVIVSDNSTDRTPIIAKSLGAKVFTCPKLGYGNAIIYGIQQAQGKYIVMGDSDRSYDYCYIPELIEPLVQEMADLVIGSRMKGGMRKGSMTFLHRRIGNPLITWILNKKLGTNISDAHSGMRAFTKESWNEIDTKLIPDDLCSEMLRQFVQHYSRIKEIPISYHPRDGNVKANTLVHGYRAFRFLLVHIILEK